MELSVSFISCDFQPQQNSPTEPLKQKSSFFNMLLLTASRPNLVAVEPIRDKTVGNAEEGNAEAERIQDTVVEPANFANSPKSQEGANGPKSRSSEALPESTSTATERCDFWDQKKSLRDVSSTTRSQWRL
jgi:hypothetical protein